MYSLISLAQQDRYRISPVFLTARCESVIPQISRALSLERASIPEWAQIVLDIGCGDGQGTLQAASKTPCSGTVRFISGIDIDMASLSRCKAHVPHLHCVQARGEQLPFRDKTFDYVMSAVALPYMDLTRALLEIHRVLKPGGELWASLHPQLFVWHHLLRSIRMLNWKDILYRTYVLLNGIGFHFTSKLLRFPLKRKRIESGQTFRGMTLALRSAGFTDIVMRKSGYRFVVVARCPFR